MYKNFNAKYLAINNSWCNFIRNLFSYSRAHATLDPDWDFKYWRFSFDHVAKFDLPAAFDYVASRTGQQKLFYAGHSLGTTVGFAGFSQYPELAARVKVFAALAPGIVHVHLQYTVYCTRISPEYTLLYFTFQYGCMTYLF